MTCNIVASSPSLVFAAGDGNLQEVVGSASTNCTTPNPMDSSITRACIQIQKTVFIFSSWSETCGTPNNSHSYPQSASGSMNCVPGTNTYRAHGQGNATEASGYTDQIDVFSAQYSFSC